MMPRYDLVNFVVPSQNRDEFNRLFQERNTLIEMYNNIMRQLTAIQPNIRNYKEPERTLTGLHNQADEYGNRVLTWMTDISAYKLNLGYSYDGEISENFQHLEFKLILTDFVIQMQKELDTMLKSYNDIASWIKTQEGLDIMNKVVKFAKHHPVYFTIETIIHLIVIAVGLRELIYILIGKNF